ncbi:hypothetical protein APHAL10511_007537 [Amanita phalloides]|nr:hypothetical protein APHAL10511_007537 [Amanita phalloides]
MFPPHLTLLYSSAQRAGSDAAFRTPHIVSGSDRAQNWNIITYDQFRRDVDMAATYWSSILRDEGIPNHSVIGLWLWGFSYTDVLHIYGISRAGFVPQLFSLRLPNAVVIYELLRKAQTRALIYDNNLKGVLNDCPIPCHPAVLREDMCLKNLELPVLETMSPDDTAFIFHTSGSTSGSPKLVPCSHRWIESAIAKSRQICRPKSLNRQDVIVWMGSMCHIAQSFMLFGSINYGSCIVQPTTLSFAADELVSMIQHCGVNRLNQFASYLQSHFRTARADPKLLSMLKNLDEVMYSGLALLPEDENWARKNAIKLRNLFGSTECAAILSSDPLSERNNLLSPLAGFIYRFVPVQQAQSSHRSTAQLLELVIAAESLDCPDKSLRHHDGDFHTGDLFSEAAPGLYAFRGRDDDWIKTAIGLRCDTKAIEDNIRMTCPDLVSGCVVVGAGRPSPVMFIEPGDNEMDEIELKRAIIRATRPFHSRRYTHERITSADMIVVVPPRTLPRTATKGNVRRKAVEEAYKPLLDEYTMELHPYDIVRTPHSAVNDKDRQVGTPVAE